MHITTGYFTHKATKEQTEDRVLFKNIHYFWMPNTRFFKLISKDTE